MFNLSAAEHPAFLHYNHLRTYAHIDFSRGKSASQLHEKVVQALEKAFKLF